MSGPFAEDCIVMEVETGSPDQFLRFDPDRPSGDNWLHQTSEFDRSQKYQTVIDRYALPDADQYQVSIVTVPPGESVQIGDVAGSAAGSRRGDLVRLLDRETVPDDWITETTTLASYLK